MAPSFDGEEYARPAERAHESESYAAAFHAEVRRLTGPEPDVENGMRLVAALFATIHQLEQRVEQLEAACYRPAA